MMGKERWMLLWGVGLLCLVGYVVYAFMDEGDGVEVSGGDGDEAGEPVGRQVIAPDVPDGDAEKGKGEQGKTYKVYQDVRTGLAVEYDEVLGEEDMVNMFMEINEMDAKRFQYKPMKVYVKDGSIVMIRSNPGKYESMSRVDEALAFIEKDGGIRVVNPTSSWMELNDEKKMKYLLDYLDSKGWGGYKQPQYNRAEKTMAFVDVEVSDEFAKEFEEQLPVLKESKIMPAQFVVYSRGKHAMTQDRYYGEEWSIARAYSMTVLGENWEGREVNPFEFGFGSGMWEEEPTPEGIEKWGILHKK